MSDVPCQMGCPCPGPRPTKLYESFKAAVDALELVYLKPGHMMPVFYTDASLNNEVHCVIGVGNYNPGDSKLIISDSSRNMSLI